MNSVLEKQHYDKYPIITYCILYLLCYMQANASTFGISGKSTGKKELTNCDSLELSFK